jgi:hypothetical protein
MLSTCHPVLIPTVEGDQRPSGGVVDASSMVLPFPRASLLDRKERSEVPPPKKAPRFKLRVDERVVIVKSAPVTHDAAIARLLLSMVAKGRLDWCGAPLWEEAPVDGDKAAWKAWVDRYMDEVPADWGWRIASRASNLASAWDHGANWCGCLGKDLVQKGFVIQRGVLNPQQVSLLLKYHLEWHRTNVSGVGIHVSSGQRGMQVYIHPDKPDADPFLRPEGGYKSIGRDHKDLKEWHAVLETLKLAAGRQDWPLDIDCMCNWFDSTPQQNHQDGTFSVLACTVALQSNTLCTMFGAYAGRNVMTMGRQDRSDWIAEKFAHCEEDKSMVSMPTLHAGDVVFFHSAHIHRGPANCSRRGKRRPEEPRRTFFFAFDSDSKTCEADVVTADNCQEKWNALVPANNLTSQEKHQWVQKTRRKRRGEMLQKE